MKSQAELLLQEFRLQIDVLITQLNVCLDPDEKENLEFSLDECKKVIVKLERLLTQREMEHEQA
jgi:hypothetical protein